MNVPEGRKTILVVDDETSILKLFSTALSINGFKVLEAVCGYEGLAMLTRQPVDLVITDWKMPNMNGLSLLRNIREKDELRDLPVLMISGSEVPNAIERAHELGACGWLTKPFKFHKLIKTIDDILEEN